MVVLLTNSHFDEPNKYLIMSQNYSAGCESFSFGLMAKTGNTNSGAALDRLPESVKHFFLNLFVSIVLYVLMQRNIVRSLQTLPSLGNTAS